MRFSRAPAIASFSLFVHQLFETCVCVFFPLIFPLPLSPLLSLASSYIFSACSHCSYLWCSHLLPKLSFISSVSLFTFVSITVFYSAILLFAQRRRIYRKNIREEIAWCCTVKCERILNENDSREKKRDSDWRRRKMSNSNRKNEYSSSSSLPPQRNDLFSLTRTSIVQRVFMPPSYWLLIKI